MAILSIGELLDLGNSAATAGLVPYSALEYNASGDISGISGSAIAGGVDTTIVSSIASSYVESGVSGKADQSALEDCCSAMSAVVSAKLDASASSQFQQSGNYQPSGDYYSATNPSGFITTADITGKLDTTASSLFQPSGDYADASSLSGKLDASASGMFAPSGNYQSAGDYAYNSSLSSKLDASASSQFYPMTGNPSGFLTGVDLTDYATTAYVDSSVSGKLDASASGQFQTSGEYYSASNPSGFITGVDLSNYATTAYVDSSVSSKVDQSAFDDCCISVQSALSGKLDASASGEFYPSGNPSGFITGVDLSNYATTAYVDSSVSGKLDHSAVETDEDGYVTGIDGSAIAGGSAGVDSATVSAIASSYAESATSGLSGKYWPLSSAKMLVTYVPGFSVGKFNSGNRIVIDTGSGILYERSADSKHTKTIVFVDSANVDLCSYRLDSHNQTISSIENRTTPSSIYMSGYSRIDSGYYDTARTSLSSTSEWNSKHISGHDDDYRLYNGSSTKAETFQWYLGGDKVSGSAKESSKSSYWSMSPNCVSGSSLGDQDVYWKLDSSNVFGKNWGLNAVQVEGSSWQLGKTEYDYWNAKMDAVPTSTLLAGSGLVISSNGDHYSINIDIPTLKTMLGIL